MKEQQVTGAGFLQTILNSNIPMFKY